MRPPEIAKAIAEEIWPNSEAEWVYFNSTVPVYQHRWNQANGYSMAGGAGGCLGYGDYKLIIRLYDDTIKLSLYATQLEIVHRASFYLADPSSIEMAKTWFNELMRVLRGSD